MARRGPRRDRGRCDRSRSRRHGGVLRALWRPAGGVRELRGHRGPARWRDQLRGVPGDLRHPGGRERRRPAAAGSPQGVVRAGGRRAGRDRHGVRRHHAGRPARPAGRCSSTPPSYSSRTSSSVRVSGAPSSGCPGRWSPPCRERRSSRASPRPPADPRFAGWPAICWLARAARAHAARARVARAARAAGAARAISGPGWRPARPAAGRTSRRRWLRPSRRPARWPARARGPRCR